ncbi:MAG: hypothetical protein Q4E35_04050 [Eubacteriales bacterium]|nr:hypothetical protein [Eubacteriales bacterium]
MKEEDLTEYDFGLASDNYKSMSVIWLPVDLSADMIARELKNLRRRGDGAFLGFDITPLSDDGIEFLKRKVMHVGMRMTPRAVPQYQIYASAGKCTLLLYVKELDFRDMPCYIP